MAGIPPALQSDSEDVAWALQTADALWKRNERADAIVWLRRAAQAAADTEDDDRALALARDAAELTEWAAAYQRSSVRAASPSPPSAPMDDEELDEEAVIELLPSDVSDSHDEVTLPEIPVEQVFEPVIEVEPEPARGALASALRRLASAKEAAQRAREPEAPPVPAPLRPAQLAKPPSAPRTPVSRAPVSRISSSGPAAPLAIARVSSGRSLPPPSGPPPRRSPPPLPPSAEGPSSAEVPSAAEVHAGILDPWADGERPGGVTDLPEPKRSPSASSFDAEEVVTSAPPVVRPRREEEGLPLPVRSAVSSARLRAAAAAAERPPIDLSGVEALSDLPDDAREAFAQSATTRSLARNEEVSPFALALVMEGSADISSAVVGAAVLRLSAREVVRGRGTLDRVAPLRLVASPGGARIATWEEHEVAAAFRSCPWVEDDLRAAGDRVQALAGATMGRLGDRLDAALRTQVTERLTLRVLAEDEVVARAGQPIPGLLVVGVGELELVGGEGPSPRGTLRSGDFLFPSEMLRAAMAPSEVRAGKGGALVLTADRAIAQELLVTCPPLLELFSEG